MVFTLCRIFAATLMRRSINVVCPLGNVLPFLSCVRLKRGTQILFLRREIILYICQDLCKRVCSISGTLLNSDGQTFEVKDTNKLQL